MQRRTPRICRKGSILSNETDFPIRKWFMLRRLPFRRKKQRRKVKEKTTIKDEIVSIVFPFFGRHIWIIETLNRHKNRLLYGLTCSVEVTFGFILHQLQVIFGQFERCGISCPKCKVKRRKYWNHWRHSIQSLTAIAEVRRCRAITNEKALETNAP